MISTLCTFAAIVLILDALSPHPRRTALRRSALLFGSIEVWPGIRDPHDNPNPGPNPSPDPVPERDPEADPDRQPLHEPEPEPEPLTGRRRNGGEAG